MTVLLTVLGLPGHVHAADFGSKSQYRITGFSFDLDAVKQSSDGIHFESSRFKPLMITSANADILTDNPFMDSFSAATAQSAPHGFAVAAEYLATPDLAFHGVIGVTEGSWDANASLDSKSSWEANIGVVYRLFNSLSYEVHFGYMDTGDVFKQAGTYSEVDSVIMVSNQLTMSF